MDNFIVSTLEQDSNARNNVIAMEQDVFMLEDLCDKVWDHSLPTVILHESYMEESVSKTLLTSSLEVKKRLLEKYPQFRDVDMSNIFIAGGSISNIIIGYDKFTDVDLFIYGLPLSEISARISKLFRDLKLDNKKGKIMKSSTATTIMSNNEEDKQNIIQIIHRMYESPSEVLHGFDIGSCSVGLLFNESKVITTTLGKVALEYRINIFDRLKRASSYETRLAKYANRGFNIVFPDLDVAKVSNRILENRSFNLAELDIISYRVVGNKVFCSEIASFKERSDYEAFDIAKFDEDNNAKYNINKLLRDKPLIYFKKWENIEELSLFLEDNEVSHPTDEDIDRYVKNTVIYSSNQLKVKKLKYLLPDSYKVIAMEYMEVENGDTSKADEMFFKALTDRIKALFEKYKELGGYIKQWVKLNINSSFHPRVISNEKFYGDYYKKVE